MNASEYFARFSGYESDFLAIFLSSLRSFLKKSQFKGSKSSQTFSLDTIWEFESHVLNDGSNRYFKCNAEFYKPSFLPSCCMYWPVPPARLRVVRSQAGGEVLVEAAPPPRVQVKRGEVRQLRVGLLLVVLHARVLCKQSRVMHFFKNPLMIFVCCLGGISKRHLAPSRAWPSSSRGSRSRRSACTRGSARPCPLHSRSGGGSSSSSV